MSKLDDLLKDAQSKKLKSEFLQFMKKKIGDVTDIRFKSVEKEIKDQIFAFFDAQIDMIESGEISCKEEVENLFQEKEVVVLKKMAERLANREETEKAPEEPGNVVKTRPVGIEFPSAENMPKQDKIAFAVAHRGWGGKEVRFHSNPTATGTVIGINAPYIIVKLKTGATIKTTPEDLIS